MTQDKLIDLCRYDIGWVDAIGGSDKDAYPLTGYDVQCENEYPMLLSDLKTALTNFDENDISFEDFLFDWWYPITTYFYEDLCLDEFFGPDPDMIETFPYPPLADNDEDMIITLFVKIARIADGTDNGDIPHGTASAVLGIPALLALIENYEDNRDLPYDERTYTREQMLAFLNHWDNSLLLSDAREDVINHFVDFTNILCKQHVFEALKIKAFACNGGNAAFPCDYAEAVNLLTILLKEFGFGYAANTLGFIYYDGKLTGKPDFDKAFAYFAIASNYGISEAKLKFADMLLMGDAGNPDPILAYNTYLQVYHDARIRFESGDYNSNLPESAIRIARALKFFPDQKVKRLKLLLEATYASFVRYQNNKVYSDLEFSKSIQTEIDKTINEFTKDDPVKINTGWQQLGLDDVNDVFDDFSGPPFPAYYTVGVKKLKSNRYKLTLKRHSLFPDAYPPLSLSVQPWLLRAGLCDNLVFTLPPECGNEALDYLARSGEEGTFDKLVVRSNEQKTSSRFSFVRNGQVVLGFEAGKIFFNKPSGKTIS
jgi:TPR repeat protein